MLATRLFEGEPDAVPAVTSLTRPALLRNVGRHLALLMVPATGGVTGTGQGVRMSASSEQFHPVMVNPATSSSRDISQARDRVLFSAVWLSRWLLMLRSMGKPQSVTHAFVVSLARMAMWGFIVVMASQSASALLIGVGVSSGSKSASSY